MSQPDLEFRTAWQRQHLNLQQTAIDFWSSLGILPTQVNAQDRDLLRRVDLRVLKRRVRSGRWCGVGDGDAHRTLTTQLNDELALFSLDLREAGHVATCGGTAHFRPDGRSDGLALTGR